MRSIDFLQKYKKIGIIGIARSGVAIALKLKELGCDFYLSDIKPKEEFRDLVTKKFRKNIEYGGHTDKLLEMDLLIVSPGVPLNIPILVAAREKEIPIWSEIEFAYRVTHPATKIIAVTGSNGKSTTVSIIYHILKKMNFDVALGGNIGRPYSSLDIAKKLDFIVLEVSSFQLELIQEFRADISVILNITPDHLDRYSSFEEYVDTKFKIFQNQDKNDLMIVNADCKVSLEKAMTLPYSSEVRFIYAPDDYKSMQKEYGIKLKGIHNFLNIQAAMQALSRYVSISDFYSALSSFKPLEHRLETFTRIRGVEYVNDSKATNTESVKYAVMSYDAPIHLILGGSDKGEDFSVLIDYLQDRIKKLYLIGETAQKMNEIFAPHFSCEVFKIFEHAVKATIQAAQVGDVVLLSPACASFDWFKNYEERGVIFKKIVKREVKSI